jgi:arylsulfatase A-like enzyme
MDEKILPQGLKQAGYETAIVGKWHLGHSHPGYLPMQRGFDHQYGCYNGMIDYVTHTMNRDLKWEAQLVEPDKIATPAKELLGHDWHRNEKALYEKGYATDLIRDEAIRIIKERDSSKPLFLYVSFTAPHTPLQAKAEDLEPYEDAELDLPDAFGQNGASSAKRVKNRRHYAAMVSGMDKAIGEILDTLKQQGMYDNTLVAFLSDNGGSYQGGNNDPLRSQKMLLYEGGVRVPAIVSFPNKIDPGTMVDEPLHVVDIYPTLLKLAGAPLEQKHPLDGMDIWPTITEGAASPHQEILINARKGRSSAIRAGDWKLVRNGRLGPIKTLDEGDDVYELFNLSNDPLEKNNLAAKEPEKVDELVRRLDIYTNEAVAPLYKKLPKNAEPTPKTWRPFWWLKE